MKRIFKAIIPESLHPQAKNVFFRVRNVFGNKKLVARSHDANLQLEYLIGSNRYGKYCVPSSSKERLAAKKILAGDIYEPDTLDFMVSHCANGDIVHAGTYFGDFLPALSKACSKDYKVWAFEPNRENFLCAEKTVSLNALDNVELENAGLGERQQQLTMITADTHGVPLGGRSRLVDPQERGLSGQTETVQVVSIDEVVPRDRLVSIIQLDVEGHEEKALVGGMQTIRRSLPIIIIESYSDGFFESPWFSTNLKPLGYEMAERLHNNTVLRPST